MGDNGPPAKKRGASRQISKDDESSDSEGPVTTPTESGSFPKASEEVLANRRIVKVRRGSNPPASSGPNPFASIRLVPPTSSDDKPSTPTPPSVDAPKPSELIDQDVKPSDADNAKGESSNEQHNEESATKDGAVEANESIADVPLKEGSEKNGDGNGTETNGVHTEEPQQVLSAPDDQSKGKAEEEDKGEGEGSKGEKDESTEEGPGLGQDESSGKGIVGKDVVEEASDGTAKGMVQKAPFSFGAGGSSTEAPPSGFALFSSSWAFGSGSSSGSGSTTAISTTANATTFSNSNNTDSSSFQLFGSQGSTVFSTSPAFSQPPLPSSTQFQEVSVKTGEEEEKVVFGGDATLFEFADGSWKERGKGEMKVNVPEEKTSKPRLVMRSKGNYKLLLNAGLFADMKLATMDSRGVTFACVNSVVEGKSGLTTYAVKFRDSTSAASFRDAVEKHKTGPQQQPQQEKALKAPENSPSAVHESS